MDSKRGRLSGGGHGGEVDSKPRWCMSRADRNMKSISGGNRFLKKNSVSEADLVGHGIFLFHEATLPVPLKKKR